MVHDLTVAHIRPEDPASLEDLSAIRLVNDSAFGGREESAIVDRLRAAHLVLASLVATVDGRIAGHILFSRMTIETPARSLPVVALAPLAVLPAFQRRGIGSALVRRGLSLLEAHGERIVLVAGHPHYYPRFGFSAHKATHIQSPFSPDAFMALDLAHGALEGVRGPVKYPAAFGL